MRDNEDRADDGGNLASCSPDWGSNDLDTDVRDALSNIIHWLFRAGMVGEPSRKSLHDLWDSAIDSAQGDLEDGPEASFDPTIVARHEGDAANETGWTVILQDHADPEQGDMVFIESFTSGHDLLREHLATQSLRAGTEP